MSSTSASSIAATGSSAPPAAPGGNSGGSALAALTMRELIRFTRQPSRVFAAIATPLLLWVFFGSGFAHSFSQNGTGAGYTAFLIPGMASLTVMFSSIFAAISLIEDRNAGFLQSVLVSPAPRWAVVGAKIAGGTIVATLQGVLLLLLAPILGLRPGIDGFLLAALALVAISVGINGLGLAAAWRIDSTQGFHGVMNLVLMPMWLLSGSIFPISGAAGWLKVVMMVNPLYWPTAALRVALSGGTNAEPFSIGLLWGMTIVVGAAGFVLAWMVVGRVGLGGRRGASL
jgi:ABC-2 type transport system permease protein